MPEVNVWAQRVSELFTQPRSPALHSMLHRYGMPKGSSAEQQRLALRELEHLLQEAFNLGTHAGAQIPMKEVQRLKIKLARLAALSAELELETRVSQAAVEFVELLEAVEFVQLLEAKQ